MKPAREDLKHRRPVWEAMSGLFLDTDTSLDRARRVGILARSPYSVHELESILIEEVYPVCAGNLSSIAGEWAGFDSAWLENSILRHLQSAPSLWRRFGVGPFIVLRSAEWRRTKQGVTHRRNQYHANDIH